MKLLLFSDLHTDVQAAQNLVQLADKVDVLVGAGDFGNMRRNISTCIKILLNCRKPAILVAGNNESTEELVAECRHWPTAKVLHGTGTEIDGVRFYGVGGGIPLTPFGTWSYDFSEESAEQLLKDCPQHGILICHSPPFGLVDINSQGKTLGSRAIRSVIDRCKPSLLVCGHIHHSAGQYTRAGSTLVVNAGPQGIIVDNQSGQFLPQNP